jgi:hypothetical protein
MFGTPSLDVKENLTREKMELLNLKAIGDIKIRKRTPSIIAISHFSLVSRDFFSSSIFFRRLLKWYIQKDFGWKSQKIYFVDLQYSHVTTIPSRKSSTL